MILIINMVKENLKIAEQNAAEQTLKHFKVIN